jgi:hypothetical protein
VSLLLIAPLVLLVAWLWLTTRAVARVRREVGEAESRLARRFYKLHGRVAEIDGLVRELEFERKRRRGEIRFAPETRVAEALAVHPKVGEILAAYGLAGSGCSGGGGPPEDATLAEVCSGARLDLRAVLATMDRFLDNPDAPIQAEPATARLHSIRSLPLSS